MLPIYQDHIFPVFALVMLTFGIMILMGKRRFKAIRNGKIPIAFFKDYQKREAFLIPEEVQLANRHYENLFEMPILFYALIPLLIITDRTDNITLFFSWAFVVARYVHAIIHLTNNKLFWRMRAFTISSFILFLLWVRFVFQLLS